MSAEDAWQGEVWQGLRAALDRRAEAGRPVTLWLRDDDAQTPGPALDRLAALSMRHGVPVLLAVIPEGAGPALATRLAGAPLLAPCQHGYSHRNHAPADEKKREFGPDRPEAAMLQDIVAGRDRLLDLFGPALRRVFVPPWNRIDAGLAMALPGLGLPVLSAFGRRPVLPGAPPHLLNCQVDIMRWGAAPAGREAVTVAAELAALVETGNEAPIGILTHHRVHDETAWAVIEALAALGAAHPGARWAGIAELAPEACPPAQERARASS